MLARQLLADAVLQRQLLVLAVEEIGLAGFDVTVGADQHERFIFGRRAEVYVFVRQTFFQQLVIGLERLVAPVNRLRVVLIGRAAQLISRFGKYRPAEIDAIHRVGADQLLFAGFRIEQDKARQINLFAFVSYHIDALAVFVKTSGVAGLEDGARINLLEAVAVNPQRFCVAIVRRANGQPQLALQIEDPTDEPLGVLANQRPLAGGDFDLVEIVPGLIAVVDPDIHQIGIAPGHGVNLRRHLFQIGQIAGFRRGFSRRRRLGGVDGIDVVILVAVFVLNEQNVFSVTTPEIAWDRAFGFAGDQFGRAERLFNALDPDVARVFIGFEERDEFAVG